MAQIVPFAGRKRRSRSCAGRSTPPSRTPSSRRRLVSLVSKLVRLILERPDAVEAVEDLIDKVLAHDRSDR